MTQKVAYAMLHEEGQKAIEHLIPDFLQLKRIAGDVASKRFNEIISSGTPPAIFTAFLDLYQTTVAGQILLIFDQLEEIGAAHRDLLGDTYYLDWAREQSIHIIRYESYRTPHWIRQCCDIQERDPVEDGLPFTEWMTWRAPKLLGMKPAQQRPYDARAV